MTTAVFEPTRWQDYAVGTEAEAFAWWCERNLEQSVDRFAGEKLVLEPWQLEFMGEALSVRDADGTTPYWLSNVLILPRKNGKTALLAAYALWRLLNDEGQPEILLAAASDKQAGRLFKAVVAYARRNPELRGQVHLREYMGEIARADGGGAIYRLANDPDTLHGYNPSLVIVDELHAWTKPSHEEAWAALTTSGGARTRTQVFTITTAGDARLRQTSILGRMLDRNEQDGDVDRPDVALTISRNHPGRTLIYNYSAPTTDAEDIESLLLANPASWVGREYIEREANNPELTPAKVLQLHGCVWAAGDTTWIAPEEWMECRSQRRLEHGEQIVLGFDGSETRDATVLSAATLDGFVTPLRVWEKPRGAGDQWRVPRHEVHQMVDAAFELYDVVELAADPPGWYQEIDTWRQRHGEERVVDFETRQWKRLAPACERFASAVRAGDVSHPGDEVLDRHVANAVASTSPFGVVIQKDHPDSPRKIDAAVAALIAFDRAAWHAANRAARQRWGALA